MLGWQMSRHGVARSGWLLGTVAGFVGQTAQAHLLECSVSARGQPVVSVTSYPQTILLDVAVANTHPTLPSEVDAVAVPVLSTAGGALPSFEVPGIIPLGATVSGVATLPILDRVDCLRLAALDGVADAWIDVAAIVRSPLGEVSCAARVVCGASPPGCGDVEDSGGGGDSEDSDDVCACDDDEVLLDDGTCGEAGGATGATRSQGFYKTHEAALQQCVDRGPVVLGPVVVTSLESALGILWGDPQFFASGATRNHLEKKSLLLSRDLLTSECNVRLFGTLPADPTLMARARAALSGDVCEPFDDLQEDLQHFIASGEDRGFPAGFVPGAATPQHAEAIATDPTPPLGRDCADD